jgi:hypothetical protein
MQTTDTATATATHTCTAIAMSIDTAKRRTRTNMFTSMLIRTFINTRIRTNIARSSIGMSTSIRNMLSSRTIMLTIHMIFIRMIIVTTRPDGRFRREARDRGGESPLAGK